MSKQFYITESRFLQQEGDLAPRYVQASANNPALVTIPDHQLTRPGKDGKRVPCDMTGFRPAEKGAPKKPKPAHAGATGGLPHVSQRDASGGAPDDEGDDAADTGGKPAGAGAKPPDGAGKPST